MDGIQCHKFRFKFRYAYIGIVNLKQMIVGLIFKFRGACIYT